jgi:hypothetical protein
MTMDASLCKSDSSKENARAKNQEPIWTWSFGRNGCREKEASTVVTVQSVAGSWTPGASDNCKILQDRGNNSRIKSFPTANIRLTPIDRRDHLPSSALARKNDSIILRHLWKCRGLAIWQGRVDGAD